MRDMEAFAKRAAECNRRCFVQLQPYRFQVIGIESNYDLMSSKFGKYGEMNTGWTGTMFVASVKYSVTKPPCISR